MKEWLPKMKSQLGWQGSVGLVLLILAGGFLVLVLNPLEQETIQLSDNLEKMRSKAALRAGAASIGGQQQELDLFFNSLPGEPAITDILAGVYSEAEATGVEVKQAEYRMEGKGKYWAEYRMSFPVRGEYGRIRIFLSRVLAEHAAVGLDQISFRRDKINDPVLGADIKLTVFLRTMPSGGS